MTTAAMPPRAAVHGFAFRPPLGREVDAVLRRLCDGERAAAINPLFSAGTYPCGLGAALPAPPAPSRHRKFLRRMGLHAVEVAAEALHHARARVPALANLPDERLGLYFGYGGLRAPWDELLPAMQQQTDDLLANWDKGLRLLHPFFMLQQLSNNAQALCAEDLAARGEGLTLAGANSGAQALVAGLMALAAGTVDAALCVAYDSLLAPEVLIEQGLRGTLTGARNLADLRAPYEATAAGAVPGEAAAALLLLRAATPPPLCFLRAADGADGGSTPQGGPLSTTLAGTAAALLSGPVAVVDGAAQALPALDGAERQALAAARLVTADAVLTATLGSFGQVGAAAPLLQVMAMTAALRAGTLPPIAGLSVPARAPLRPLTQATATAARTALCLSAGSPGLCGAVYIEVSSP
jgi:3-oxoacyl-(acyl-carrier-protein) synthase